MLKIIYEDNHLIAINKRSGDIIQSDITGDTPLSDHVKNYLKLKYEKSGKVFLGTIHRLDRPTSGVIIFAKTSKALNRMNKLFRDNNIKKSYLAIVENKPKKIKNKLINYLKKNSKQNKSYVVKKKEGKISIMEYELIKSLDNYFILKINLFTGRHHQIRAQLANINCYIKGDLKYGAKRSNNDGSICLHAHKINFQHPIKKVNLSITAETPKNKIWTLC